MIFGITMGDSSGVGPEIVLKAHAEGRLQPHRCVVYGDLDVLAQCNATLQYGVSLRSIERPENRQDGHLNIIDLRQMRAAEISQSAPSRTIT